VLTGWWFGTMEFYFPFHIWIYIYKDGMSSFPLTNSYFSRMFFNHQPDKVWPCTACI
jgi:hypothetical protein